MGPSKCFESVSRIYDPTQDVVRFEKVGRLEEGQIYSGVRGVIFEILDALCEP